MAVTDCIRCGTKAPGDYNGWDGFREWMITDTEDDSDDLRMICPDCITAEELILSALNSDPRLLAAFDAVKAGRGNQRVSDR